MKQLGCMRASILIDRRAAGLSAADALRLEDHLAGCERCSRDAQLLGGLRALSHAVDGTLVPNARARAIDAALARAAVHGATFERSRVHASLRLGAALAAAALLVLALRPGGLHAPEPAAPGRAPANTQVASANQASAPAGDRVLSGVVEVDGRSQGAGAALQSGDVLHVASAARVALAHAQVDLRAGSDVRWDAGARVLRLEAGSIVADVDPSAHRSFAVETARFRVLVLGTRFEVTPFGVRVERGRVRVVAPDGALLGELGAGESYTASDAANQLAPAPAAGTAPSSAHNLARSARPAQRADAGALLATARTQLGQKQAGAARQTIDAALALTRERPLRGEALTLRAECALVEGDQAAAVEAYLRVARAFAELPAGENALFAAARIEAERGRTAAAAQLLDRYLERYPHGRFEREARARLRTLSAALDRAP